MVSLHSYWNPKTEKLWFSYELARVMELLLLLFKKTPIVSSPLILPPGFSVTISHITNSSVRETWNTEQNQSNSHTLLSKTDLWKMQWSQAPTAYTVNYQQNNVSPQANLWTVAVVQIVTNKLAYCIHYVYAIYNTWKMIFTLWYVIY